MAEQMLLDGVDNRSAVFSACRRYRYALGRVWGRGPGRLVVIGLNPSTADETEDDPTIRRCVGFARRLELDGLAMVNLFAFRATDPKDLRAAADPVGPMNDAILDFYANAPHSTVVAAWGVHGGHRDRGAEIAARVSGLQCWGTTKGGHPRHPLYLRADTPLIPFPATPTTEEGESDG